MGPLDLGRPLLAREGHDDLAVFSDDAETLGVGADIDALAREERRHCLRHLLVLARDEARADLHDRDLAAAAAVPLAELEPDVAAAQHQQMPPPGNDGNYPAL